MISIYVYARLAQLVEHSTDTRAVPSSNLGSRTKMNFTFLTNYVMIVIIMEKPIFIRRKIDTKIQQYLKLPEILAIVGPRQAGKTIYLEFYKTLQFS